MQLVTWNTQWCRGLDGRVDPARIVQYALALGDVDVLCLQEIAVNYPGLAGAPGDQVAQVQSALPAGWQVFFGAAVDEWTAAGRQRFGNLIATRLPVLQLQHHPLPYPADAGVPSMPRMCTVATVRDPALGAVRVMTTHLEFYSKRQRMAQARALRALHGQACAQVAAPPQARSDGSPFQSKPHTPHAVLCGDFNFEAHEPEHAAICAPAGAYDNDEAPHGARLWDSWRLLHGNAPQPPTFRLYDRTDGPEPVACDFVFVSDSLQGRVQRFGVDAATQASDHQPVAVLIG